MPFGTLAGKKTFFFFGEVCQALLMKSNPFVFFAAGCILSVLVIVPLQLYFLTVSFMLDEG